ncbi:UDP-glucuronosyltransferase [Plakobranchus ocellatus]|uniref:UDP-glucuronosyltransferase n=1 Tax=Plakobranchus ocellatus TaxID=259542 RepID=A0AAV4AHZ1_9GAST|nr:UDP-glucuronosyltransferase [Plakobranchus ocellatus]
MLLRRSLRAFAFSLPFWIASLSLSIHSLEAKLVVLFPYFQTSYVLTSVRVANALASFDHDIYICIPEHSQNEISKEIVNSVNILTYVTDFGDLDEAISNDTSFRINFWSENFDEVMLNRGNAFASKVYQRMLTNKNLLYHLQNLQADLYVFDSAPIARYALLLAYKFQVPFVVMGSFYDALSAKIPSCLTSIPNIHSKIKFSFNLHLFERFQLSFQTLKNYLDDTSWDENFVKSAVQDKAARYYRELVGQAELYLVEAEHIFDFVRPSLPNVRLIGGISSAIATPLQGKLKAFLDSSATRGGFIVVSFGHFGGHIPEEIIDKISLALSMLSIPVVWLVKDRLLMSTSNIHNVYKTKLVSQNDVLGHSGALALMSTCDTQSQYEALYHAVPILCLPLYGEQFHNAHRAEVKGFGMQADIRTIPAQSLAKLIQVMAQSEYYRDNIRLASALFRELFGTPSETAAWWIDHVVQYGGGYMRFPGQNMPMYQVLGLDVYVAEVMLLATVVGLLWWVCSSCPCLNNTLKGNALRFRNLHRRKFKEL